MAYAFSRDGAMPLSSFWHKVNKQEVPINAVWVSAFISFCMALTVSIVIFLFISKILVDSFSLLMALLSSWQYGTFDLHTHTI